MYLSVFTALLCVLTVQICSLRLKKGFPSLLLFVRATRSSYIILSVYLPFVLPSNLYYKYLYTTFSCVCNSFSVYFSSYILSVHYRYFKCSSNAKGKAPRISAGDLLIHSLVPALARITSRCTWRKRRCRWRAWPSSWRWTQPQPCRRGAAYQPSHRKCQRPCGRSGYGR